MCLVDRAYTDVGKEHQNDHRNCAEISSGDLNPSGTWNQTRIDISSTRHLGHERCVRGSGENNTGILLASSFIQKDEYPLPRRRGSK